MRGRNYERKSFFLFVVVCVCALCAVGCRSVPKTGGADVTSVVEGNARAVGRLEAAISSLDGTVAASRKRIGAVIKASRSIEDGIERAAYLFECYESEVSRLLSEIERIRAKAENEGKDNRGCGECIGSGSGGSPSIIHTPL